VLEYWRVRRESLKGVSHNGRSIVRNIAIQEVYGLVSNNIAWSYCIQFSILGSRWKEVLPNR
jgi:hypothetical protein